MSIYQIQAVLEASSFDRTKPNRVAQYAERRVHPPAHEVTYFTHSVPFSQLMSDLGGYLAEYPFLTYHTSEKRSGGRTYWKVDIKTRSFKEKPENLDQELGLLNMAYEFIPPYEDLIEFPTYTLTIRRIFVRQERERLQKLIQDQIRYYNAIPKFDLTYRSNVDLDPEFEHYRFRDYYTIIRPDSRTIIFRPITINSIGTGLNQLDEEYRQLNMIISWFEQIEPPEEVNLYPGLLTRVLT